LYPTDPNEIILIVSELSNKTSSGHDFIPVDILKASIFPIAVPLSGLINKSFEHGVFPDALKIGKVCPVFKSGDKSSLANYRPISILPSFSKIYEKAMYNRLSSFLSDCNILVDNQYGFRKNHSTYMALVDLYDKISNAIDNNEFAMSVFIDLSKAFDTLDHNILCNKLYYYGVRGTALDLFRSYLTNRKQYVCNSGNSSSIKDVMLGVPQGSVLGPLLFILYINDIVNCSKLLHFFLFADDTTLFRSNKNFIKLIEEMNTELDYLTEWFRANRLSLNSSKTHFIVFGNKHVPGDDDYQITLDGTILKRVQSTKFLGVFIDEKLTWNQHINNICAKASRGVGIISRMRNVFPPATLKLLYDTLIYPYLTYCCVIWGSAYMNVLNNIIVIQNKALRLITNSKYRTSAGPLYVRLNLLRVVDIYKYQVLLFMFKVRNYIVPNSCMNYVEINPSSEHNTRSASYFKLFRFRTNTRQHSISIAGPRLWNTIPNTLQNSVCLSQFKKSLKQWLCDQFCEQSSNLEYN
jgi:hypothetical protein